LQNEGDACLDGLLKEKHISYDFDTSLDLLGDIGLYLAALNRHEMNLTQNTSSNKATSLLCEMGILTGVAPRLITAHLTIRNKAIKGTRKYFTSLKDEILFLDENTRGILAFQCAANAVMNISYVGVSSAVADTLFATAKNALEHVLHSNKKLLDNLDVKRFFYCVRPYYKPYRVGNHEYRGPNAGDFSYINELDLLLGLCSANDPFYEQLLTEKMTFMLPVDQERLRKCLNQVNLLDELLALSLDDANKDWFQCNVRDFLKLFDLYSKIAFQHHEGLVKHYVEEPAKHAKIYEDNRITASGPPLSTVIKILETLRDFRMAANREDIMTRYEDISKLKKLVGMI